MNSRIEVERAQLASALVLLMLASLAAPSLLAISTESDELVEQPTRFPTANGTVDEGDAQTLLSNLNANNPIDVMGVMDDSNRIHLVWIENTSTPLLRYALIQISSGVDTVLISTTQVGDANATSLSSPAMVIDSQGRVHLVWAITDTDILYTLLDPSEDDLDGSAGDIQNMTIASHTVADGTGTRSSPDIAVDSYDAVHIVWVDTYDPQGIYFGSPLIYYCMLSEDSNNGFQVLINATLVTPALGHRGNPAVSIGANNTVVIVWEDTRGSIVEYVGLLDSSGSMTTEWIDMCAVFYGGTLTTGENFAGIKPMLEAANITVLETLYTLSGNMANANSHQNCANAITTGNDGSNGPRATSLGQNTSDTSGGIRPLTEVVYNGSALSIPSDWGYYSEMWGPGSTWACESWRDASGSAPGNPPTTVDHAWNPNATKLVIPVSDEGPFGGSPALNADDYQSINESHAACLQAGVIPVPVAGTLVYGPSTIHYNDTHVRHHMMSLAHCPDMSQVGVHARSCNGTTVENTNAGGEMFYYPTEELTQFHGDFENTYITTSWTHSGAANWFVQDYNRVLDGNYSAQAGAIGHSQHSTLEYAGAMNAGTLSFNYSISSEVNYDYLLFCVDNPSCSTSSFTSAWSGEGNGTYTAAVAPGYHTYTWKYVKDGSVESGNDTAWIDDVQLPIASYTDEMNQMVSAIINITTGSGATNTFLTVLNPYSMLSNPRSTWSVGDSGHTIDEITGQYQEDIGPDTDWYWREDGGGWDTLGHLVLVNDTQISKGHGWAVNPEVNVDEDGNIHIVWIDGRSTFPSKEGPSQLHYMQLDPDRQGTLDGEPNGLVLEEVMTVKDTAVLQSNLIWGANPRVDFDRDGSIHITWFETQQAKAGDAGVVELRWTRIQSPVMNGFEELPLNRYLTQAYSVVNTRTITSSTQNLMGVFGSEFDASAQPIVKFAWPERTIAWTANDCNEADSQANKWDVCKWDEDMYDMALNLHPTESGHVTMQPGQSVEVAMNLRGIQIPGSADPVTIEVAGALDDWDITVGFGENYQPTTTITEGGNEEVFLLLRAPDIRLVNDDQSFDVLVTVQSTTDDFANAQRSVRVDLVNENDWNDDDQDGVADEDDQCQFGETDWYSGTMTDYDGDGCQDATEDLDDDNDGVEDLLDECPTGAMNDDRVDADGDGCDDLLEDLDNDGDLVPNHLDQCPNGAQYWTTFSTDHDGDGCRDADEDDNDDNDPYLDIDDNCPTGTIGWTGEAYDHDSDGCQDYEEDLDDDNDGVLDHDDSCPYGMLDWTSNEVNDHDGDGCNDIYEDADVDDDGVLDDKDLCITGKFGWDSSPLTDWDGDGCHDSEEDLDDDGDGFLDVEDSCVRSMSPHIVDADFDGCDDRNEDTDLDNDGIESSEDNCETNPNPGWISALNSDRDRDGCADATEDQDDDGDGILDIDDACPVSNRVTIDHDSDGCMDEFDLDDDNDGVPDTRDQCAHGAIGWTSAKQTDIDSDGCWDSVEDMSLPRGIVATITDSPVLMAALAGLALVGVAGAAMQSRTRGRRRDEGRDGTREVIDSMRDEEAVWSVKTEPIETPKSAELTTGDQFQKLVETGYSTEVARAIVASEEALRNRVEE
ncbi:MAG: hypothetical protein P8Q45_00525 [Candidatus Thalassarchaeaceae archaeon]|nr:hypothetical protein [Candidatus Thalassarchaeaceae archaeon]